MSNIRLFFSNILSENMTDKLDKSQSHYLTKVMRVKENEVFSLFNQKRRMGSKSFRKYQKVLLNLKQSNK